MKAQSWMPILLLSVVAACVNPPGPKMPIKPGNLDAPYQIASDEDLIEIRQQYDALAANNPLRTIQRKKLAEEYATRLDRALSRKESYLAFAQFELLLSLWKAKDLDSDKKDLIFFQPQAKSILSVFSKSGGSAEATLALAMLLQSTPNSSFAYQKEIQNILKYSEESALALHGPKAKFTYSIRILEKSAHIFPSRYLVDQLIYLYQKRQVFFSDVIGKGEMKVDMDLIRIQGTGLLSTASLIAGIYIQSNRMSEIMPLLTTMKGLGEQPSLRKKIVATVHSNDTTPWLDLATYFSEEKQDLIALELCQLAMQKHPNSPRPHFLAGEIAYQNENLPLAIRHLENGLDLDPDHLKPSETLLSLYKSQITRWSYSGRPNAAEKKLKKFEHFYRQAKLRFASSLQPDPASVYAALANGLLSQGELQQAHHLLQKSLQWRPNHHAWQTRGLIALRQGQGKAAFQNFQQAQHYLSKDFSGQYDTLMLQRLQAEALTQQGQSAAAKTRLTMAQTGWLQLLKEYTMPASLQSEAQIELGKISFLLSNKEQALMHFLHALKTESDGSNNADVLAFLVNRQELEYAQDIFLDALGKDEVSRYFKIYMSLWILAEAKRQSQEPIFYALEYLEQQDSKQWSSLLAQYLLGNEKRTNIEALATTRGRRAEFLYYSAVLGPESHVPAQSKAFLEEVLRGNMLLFFEYEMAQQRLKPSHLLFAPSLPN